VLTNDAPTMQALRMRRTLAAAVLTLVAAAMMVPAGILPSAGAVETHGDGYRSWRRGNPANVHVHTMGGAMLEGGESDRWPAWEWFLKHAGYGDVVIICASCDNVYNQYVINFHKVDSVQTLKLTKRRAASDPFVVSSVKGADGIFFAGGDQSDYVRVWKDSPVEDAVNAVIARGGVVGGISAGLAILGQFLFAAEKDTIASGQALRDCFAKKITLERDMLVVPTLTSTITDTHFSQRHRMGRLLTFMARTIRDGWSTHTRGIGVDEDTAALVSRTGKARIVGQNDVSFVRMRAADVTTCAHGRPLATRFIKVHVVHRGSTFDITDWSGDPAPPLRVRAHDGALIWKLG
jgi:cyanophycinase